MDTAGVVMILIGIYLLTSAIKNRRPIDTALAVIRNPAAMRSTVQSAEGYDPVVTGPPTLSLPMGQNPVSTPTSEQETADPSMSLSNIPALQGSGSRPSNVSAGTAAGVKPVTRAGLYSIARAFPQIKSIGGRGARPLKSSDHPRGLALDFMIPKWNTKEGNALGWRLAEYVRKNAGALRVKYIIWDKKKWNPAGGSGWRPYKHPLGGGPTLAHQNHVHVSFKE